MAQKDENRDILNRLADKHSKKEKEIEEEVEGGILSTKLFGYLVIAILVVSLLYLTLHLIGAAIGLVLFVIGVIAELSA